MNFNRLRFQEFLFNGVPFEMGHLTFALEVEKGNGISVGVEFN